MTREHLADAWPTGDIEESIYQWLEEHVAPRVFQWLADYDLRSLADFFASKEYDEFAEQAWSAGGRQLTARIFDLAAASFEEHHGHDFEREEIVEEAVHRTLDAAERLFGKNWIAHAEDPDLESLLIELQALRYAVGR